MMAFGREMDKERVDLAQFGQFGLDFVHLVPIFSQGVDNCA